MSGDVHVRFCERLGVRFPRATRLVACFEREADARRYRAELTERLSAFDLEVEPSKTAVLRFGSAAPRDCHQDGRTRPETFNFLGFTHFVTRSRKGRFQVERKTQGKRFRFKLQQLNERLRVLRQAGGKAMMAYLRRHLQGHIQYYGVSGNSRSLHSYVYWAGQVLFKWLNRRSQRRSIPWDRLAPVLVRLLPKPRIVHSLYPVPTWRTQAGSRMV